MIQVQETIPGHNPHLEHRFLSACMIGGVSDVLAAAGAGVTDRTFDDPSARLVWSALSKSVADDTGTDLEPVMRAYSGLDGSSSLIVAEIKGIEPTSMYRRQLTRDVLNLARRRRLIAATASAHEEAMAGEHREWNDVWDATEPHLRAAQDSSVDSQVRSIADIAASAKRQLLQPDAREIVPTGLQVWDRSATPPRAGQLIVIAARTGAGKSAMAGQIAHHIATQGKVVAFFCLEMSAEEVLTRMARLRCYGRTATDDVVGVELDKLSKLTDLKLYDGDNAKTVAQIGAMSRLLAASPRGLGAIVIDYLQLVTPPPELSRENREQRVAAMSRSFKLLARAVNAPVFLLAQLNREMEKGEERPPRLSDLRESGSIEQDADRVWFLYQPKPKAGEMAPSRDAAVIDVALLQAKCRNGPSGIEDVMKFHRRQMAFIR